MNNSYDKVMERCKEINKLRIEKQFFYSKLLFYFKCNLILVFCLFVFTFGFNHRFDSNLKMNLNLIIENINILIFYCFINLYYSLIKCYFNKNINFKYKNFSLKIIIKMTFIFLFIFILYLIKKGFL